MSKHTSNPVIKGLTPMVTPVLMEVQLLSNGQWKPAMQIGDLFQVTMANGAIKLYTVSQVKAVRYDGGEAEEPVTENTNNNLKEEEHKMEFYHFISEAWDTHVRVFTNDMTPSELERYNVSKRNHSPYQGVMYVNTGSWDMQLMVRRVIKTGKKFRVIAIPNGEVDPAILMRLKEKSTFGWASAAYTFYVRIDGCEGWNLDALGLLAHDTQKISKRNQEILRITENHLYMEDASVFNMMLYPRPTTMNVGLVDGKSYISKKTALKLVSSITNTKRRRHMRRGITNDEITHFSGRFVGPWGVVKGDFIIHADEFLPWDILTDMENVKPDLKTTGWMFGTIWEHHTLNLAKWDEQSEINFPTVLTMANKLRDLRRLVAEIRAKIAEGKVPEELMLPEEAHNDDGLPDLDKLSESLRRQDVYWQVYGLSILLAQNLIYLWLNGLLKRMETDKVSMGLYRKTWLPMTNAFTATVNTWTSLTKMGGYKFDSHDGTKVFFDQRFGLVFPDQRFIDTFDLHGTWDLDDTVKAVLVKVFGTPEDVQRLKDQAVIPSHMEIPANESEAVWMVAIIRSPNGPGEISFEDFAMDTEVDDHMPWFYLDTENVAVVNLSTITGQPEMLVASPNMPLPTSNTYTKELMTEEDSMRQIMAQQSNPGIGSTANMLMNWANAFPGTMPVMVGTLGDKVDGTQQGADLITFEAIDQDLKSCYAQFVQKMVSDPNAKVDSHLARFRMPGRVVEQIQGHIKPGNLALFNEAYATAISTIRKEIMNQTLQMRQAQPLVQTIVNLDFGTAAMQWAEETYNRWMRALENVDGAFPTNDEMDAFTKQTIIHQKSESLKDVVDTFVTELEAFEHTNQRVLLLWKYILTPTQRMPYGKKDRVIFQPGHERSVMHVLIEALVARGWVQPLPES